MLHDQGIGVRFQAGVEEVLISGGTNPWILKPATKWRWGGKIKAIAFTTASWPTMGPTKTPTQWAPGAFLLWVKRMEREGNNSPPFSAEFSNAWNSTFSYPYAFTVHTYVRTEGSLYKCLPLTYLYNRVTLFLSTSWRHVGGVEVYLHSFLTSAIDGGEWSASHSVRFSHNPWNRRLGGSIAGRDVLGGFWCW